MVDIRNRILEVLKTTHLMSLGVSDSGSVWVADVIFLYDDDLNIYWLSAPDTRHSQAILKNNKIAGSITCSTKSKEQNFGIQFEGKAEKLEGVRFDLIAKHWTKRNKKIPDISEATEILEGDCWYKLVPTRIGLIDEIHFGFNRQELKLD
jgi:uncharacterized protein YhbP (UPF0306 family)